MKRNIIPLISSLVAGPLGVLHLVRLWQKLSLEARGKLASGYPGAGKGYDQMVISALNVDRDALIAFVKKSYPTYPEFEAWIKAQPGVKLDSATIEALNASIRDYNHDDGTRAKILDAVGILDDADAPKGAGLLNGLEDWDAFHRMELKDKRHKKKVVATARSAEDTSASAEPAASPAGDASARSAEPAMAGAAA